MARGIIKAPDGSTIGILSEEIDTTTTPRPTSCPDCARKDEEIKVLKLTHREELGKAQAWDEKLKAEQNEAIARVKELGATLEGVNMHILDPKSCGDPENCVLNKQLAEYRRKTNTAHDIAEWLREHKALGVVKDSNGKDKVFNSIEIPSLRKRK